MSDDVVETGVAAKSLLDQVIINKAAIIEICLIIFVCFALRVLLKRAKKHFVIYVTQQSQRFNPSTYNLLLTTATMCESVGKIVILLVGALACLSAVNISVSPVVYGLGFVSLGVSLGAQDTFTDVIRGILTLIEGKIAPGNCLSINGKVGFVEALSIRQVTLRHFDGSIEFFPFSKISTIQNFSLNYHVMACTFLIAPDSDIEKFKSFAQQTLDSMREDEAWSEFITESTPASPSFEFEKIGNLSVTVIVRARIKVNPANSFASEFNHRMWQKLQRTKMLRLVQDDSSS
jgi:small-conductance mechanosensitive channel